MQIMTIQPNCRLQIAILSLALHVLLLTGYSKADFKVFLSVPDQPGASSAVKFSKLNPIMSVISPYPNLITGQGSNTIAFPGQLPVGCEIPVTIIGKDADGKIVTYTGTVSHNLINKNTLDNAVGLQGNPSQLDLLINELSKTHDVKVINKKDSPPPAGNQEVIFVLADKSNSSKILPQPTTEDLVEEILKSNPALTTVAPKTGKCDSVCLGVCKGVLKVDGDSSVVTATVQTPIDIVSAGIPTKWSGVCHTGILGVCTTSPLNTCYNGGSCSSDRESSPNVCTCSPQTKLYGPRCQLLTRSYDGSSSNNYVTTHNIINDGGGQPNKLTFSFEHAGKCQLGSGMCTIVIIKAGTKQLLKIEEGLEAAKFYDTATLPDVDPAFDKMILQSDRMVQTNRWIDVTVHVETEGATLKATTLFCTKEASPVCVEKKIEKAGLVPKSREAELTLGGHVRGCFRNLRFYGNLVNLKLAGSTTGSSEGCSHQSASCSGKCGDGDANSDCYGSMSSTDSMPCSCKCGNSKRMPTERIFLASQCSAECTTESPIISIAGSATLNWKGTGSALIPLNPQAPLTISFLMRTKQATTGELFKVVGSGSSVSIKLTDQQLTACVTGNCYPFLLVPVSDGKWHEVFVMVAKTQLTVRVSDFARVYVIPSSQPAISEAAVSMQMTNGCIRDVRVSDIYMPTGGSDVTGDASASVKLDSSGSVTAGSTCTGVK